MCAVSENTQLLSRTIWSPELRIILLKISSGMPRSRLVSPLLGRRQSPMDTTGSLIKMYPSGIKQRHNSRTTVVTLGT
mgnify:CR=1 FL=1